MWAPRHKVVELRAVLTHKDVSASTFYPRGTLPLHYIEGLVGFGLCLDSMGKAPGYPF
jgi:hypothetical protein